MKFEQNQGPFLLGATPASCDAALCAFIIFAKHCPIETPSLIGMVSPTLVEYCDHVLEVYSITTANAQPGKAFMLDFV